MEEGRDKQSAPFEALTSRELEILGLLADGCSDKEVANQLSIAYTTVKWYNRQIYNKLGVEKRSQAIERAQAWGLLPSQHDTPRPTRPYKLPTQATPFIGRTHNLAELLSLIHAGQNRLVTILAPGGMGKTRLALAAAEQLMPDFLNGVTFVPLTAARSEDDIVTAVIELTGYPIQQDRRTPKQQLVDYLSDKALLLVLDNFEHLLDASTLIDDLLSAGPSIQIVVTSREKLNLTSETVYPLGGLTYWQADGGNATPCSAIRLFIQCACRAHPDFDAHAHMSDIAHICQLVEGMPLAIELAAAWVEILTPAEIASEIIRGMDILVSEMRDLPERQRSVRAIFEATWKQLSQREQVVFRSLAVFQGGCTRQAVQQITGADLRSLIRLTDKALLWHSPDGRYRIHELLRQYGAEQLKNAGEYAAILNAHAAYYARLMARHEVGFKGGHQLEALRAIDADFDNIRAAWMWAIQQSQCDILTEMVNGLYWYCALRNHHYERPLLFAPAGELWNLQNGLLPHRVWAKIAVRGQDYRDERAATILAEALKIAYENGDAGEIAFCFYQLAIVEETMRHFEQAIGYYQRSLRLYRVLNDSFCVAKCLAAIANDSIYTGHSDQSVSYAEESIALCRQLGDRLGLASTLWIMGGAQDTLVLVASGGGEEAVHYFEEAVALFREMGDEFSAAAIEGWHLAGHAAWRDDVETAYRLTEAAIRIMTEYHHDTYKGRALVMRATAALVEEDYAQARMLAAEGVRLMDKHPTSVFGRLVLAAEAAERGEHEAAYPHLFRIFQQYLRGEMVTVFEETIVMARLLAHDGHVEEAVELLALIEQVAPKSLAVRLFPRWRARLKVELGTDIYTAAWERGNSMTLPDVVQRAVQAIEKVMTT